MKKYISNIVIMAIMAVMCVTLNSCGGDDDDTPGENDVTIQYVEPCFNWGASVDAVKEWMKSKPFNLMNGEYILYYEASDNKSVITYMFDGNIKGLYFSLVSYGTTSDRDMASLISQTEKRYNTTLTKLQDVYVAYAGYAAINGRNVSIMISKGTSSVDVLFAIPE